MTPEPPRADPGSATETGAEPPARPATGSTDVTVHGGQVGAVGDNATVTITNHYTDAQEPIRWPVRVGRPPLLADSFQDRPALGDQISVAFGVGAAAVVTQTQVMTGDGGVGKSQLAVQVWRHLTRRRPGPGDHKTGAGGGVELAVWVTATSRTSIQAGYAGAATALQLSDGRDQEDAAEAFLSWLTTTDRSWLVVLDDLTDPGDLTRLWPPGSASTPASMGWVLVTTRRRDAALFGHGRHRIDVGVFTPAESQHYLRQRLQQSPVPRARDDTTSIDGLAEDLGHLPIALAQACAYILAEKTTPAAYRGLLVDQRQRLADLMPADTGDEHDRTVAATWSLAMDRADALPPAGAASRLAQLIAVLDPNGIPETVLTSQPAREYVSVNLADDLTAAQARRGLLNLDRFSIITHDPASPSRTVRMHALAQRASRENPNRHDSVGTHREADSEDQAESAIACARAAGDGLLAGWPNIERDTDLAQALRANTTTLWSTTGDCLWIPDGHAVLWRTGRSLGEAGLVQSAVEHWTAMLDTSLRMLGADHPETLATRGNLARWRGEAGDPAGAAAAFADLLADHLRALGADHPETLTTRSNLASLRGEAGDPVGAAAAFADLLADRLRVLGADHPATLTTRGNLASWRGEARGPRRCRGRFRGPARRPAAGAGPRSPEHSRHPWHPRLLAR